MTAITIPKELTKGDELIVIPRKLYERFLSLLDRQSLLSSHAKLDEGLLEALEDVKKGRMIGPFSTLDEGLAALKQMK